MKKKRLKHMLPIIIAFAVPAVPLSFGGIVNAAEQMAVTVASGKWIDTEGGRKYGDDSGWNAQDRWIKIDGKWYYFDENGYMEKDTFRNDWYLNKDGIWDGVNGKAGWRKNSGGWWYRLPDGSYLKNSWIKIDGRWYYFKADGYAAQYEFVQGWWLGKNCDWNDPVHYSWHKTSRGWWYGVTGGWYAMNASYVIEGVEYAFDLDGYLIEDGSVSGISYDEFKSLSVEEQKKTFNSMSSEAAYDLIKASPDSWVVNSYDLITPENVKGFAILRVNDKGETSFNIDWPKYGGYDPKTIASISELSGKVDASRVGGDGGYTISYGRNEEGAYPSCSERSMPVSFSELNTGTFDIDLYLKIVDIITAEIPDSEKKDQLKEMSIDREAAESLITDYANWGPRTEISGEGNIEEGFRMEYPDAKLVTKYGFYGKTAKWDVEEVHMKGGGGQMNIVFSWGTCKKAGILTDVGKTTIN